MCVELNAFSDSVLEEEEYFLVLLTSPNNTHAIVFPNQATMIITDRTGLNHFLRKLPSFILLFLSLVVSLTLEQSEYHVREGEMLVSVCANFSQTDTIDRTVLATLEMLPSDSASGEEFSHAQLKLVALGLVSLTAMTDFLPVEQTLTFNSNNGRCVDVAINNDNVLEDTETFNITLSSSDPRVVVEPIGLASITIADDDCKSSHILFKLRCMIFLLAVEVFLQDNSYEVEEGVPVLVCVSLSNAIERNVEVTLVAFSGSTTGK